MKGRGIFSTIFFIVEFIPMQKGDLEELGIL